MESNSITLKFRKTSACLTLTDLTIPTRDYEDEEYFHPLRDYLKAKDPFQVFYNNEWQWVRVVLPRSPKKTLTITLTIKGDSNIIRGIEDFPDAFRDEMVQAIDGMTGECVGEAISLDIKTSSVDS